MSEVLALSYRPIQFGAVVGQDTTISQIKSAVVKKTLGHSLLFSGTRGCGKTTTARIVAMALNCKKLQEGEPCGKCASCKVALQGRHSEIVELDAASHNGVDDVRELQEAIRYTSNGHRVIILDEAHMLSKPAFNALLKLLEEPPDNVTFILATTEPYKLPLTVKSRCQSYDFRDVDVQTLNGYYAGICVAEGIDPSISMSAALVASGSVRDGLSYLQKYLSGEKVEDSSKDYFELVGAIYQKDTLGAMGAIKNLLEKDEARTIVQTLQKWFYWCSLENFGIKTPVRDLFGGAKDLQFDLRHLQELFKTTLDIERDLFATPNSKVVLEMGVIRLCL